MGSLSFSRSHDVDENDSEDECALGLGPVSGVPWAKEPPAEKVVILMMIITASYFEHLVMMIVMMNVNIGGGVLGGLDSLITHSAPWRPFTNPGLAFTKMES